MLGYAVSDLLGKPAHATMHHTRADGAAYPQSECYIHATLKDGVVRRVTDEVFWRKDGSSFPVEYMCTPAYDKNERSGGAVVVFTDITERMRTEEVLRERGKLSALMGDVGSSLTHGTSLRDTLQGCAVALVQHLDAAFARIWTLNAQTNVLELQASAGMYTHLDGPHGCVPVGKFKIGLIAEERKPHLTNQVVGDPRVGDQEWAKREGMVSFAGYPLVVDDRVVGVMALFARHPLPDVTLQAMAGIADGVALGIERIRTDAALRESQEHMRLKTAALESAANGVVITDCQGTIQWVNAAFTQLTGYSAEEAIGQNPRLLKSGRQPESLYQEMWQTISEGHVWKGELINRRKDGQFYDEEMTITPVPDSAGAISHFVGIKQDIGDRKQVEASLENMHKKLVEASREAGMAIVATSVLHNIGNVLNSVNVSAEQISEKVKRLRTVSLVKVAALLREHTHDLPDFLARDPQGKELPGYLSALVEQLADPHKDILPEVVSLKKNIEHIREIVRMQQNYARGTGVLETVALTELVEDAIRINAAGLTRHEVQLIREYSPVPPFPIEKHKVLQILVNLLSNAKYALDAGGGPNSKLTVRVEMNGGDVVKVSVMDNGVGIVPENLTRIFQHGFTTRKDGHGFGLHSGALAAQELGGSLTACSGGPGKGAIFTLELPCQTGERDS